MGTGHPMGPAKPGNRWSGDDAESGHHPDTCDYSGAGLSWGLPGRGRGRADVLESLRPAGGWGDSQLHRPERTSHPAASSRPERVPVDKSSAQGKGTLHGCITEPGRALLSSSGFRLNLQGADPRNGA